MLVHQIYAMIKDGTVQNVTVSDNYEESNRIARAVYGDDAIAVDCTQYPCAIGDKYREGIFYRSQDGEETEIKYIPTEAQQIQALKTENEELTLAMADMIGGAV